MKLKYAAMIAAVATTGFAIADVYTSGVKLCQVQVDNTTPDAVFAVPVVGVVTDAVNPSELVMSGNMQEGDYMYVNDGGTRKAWVLGSDKATWSGAWIAADTNVTGVAIQGASASDALSRGNAVWLHRRETSPISIYLWGRVATNSFTTTTSAASGTSSGGSFKMIGNPSTVAYSILDLPWGDTKPSVGDQIKKVDGNAANGYSSTTIYYCTSVEGDVVSWGYPTRVNGKREMHEFSSADAPTIAAGEGFYYYAKGAAPTLVWPSDY